MARKPRPLTKTMRKLAHTASQRAFLLMLHDGHSGLDMQLKLTDEALHAITEFRKQLLARNAGKTAHVIPFSDYRRKA